MQAPPIEFPPDVRGQIPDIRRSQRARRSARRVAKRCAPSCKKRGLDGFVVPRADRHQNEYVPPCEERLAWLTGFTGSAGAAIVLAGPRRAVRRRPLHAAGARRRPTPRCSRSSTWSKTRPSNGSSTISRPATRSATIRGCTPPKGARSSRRPAKPPARRWLRSNDNPIDALWSDRPAPPLGAVVLHDIKLCRRTGRRQACGASAPSSRSSRPTRWWCPTRTTLAWTFNIRGADVAPYAAAARPSLIPREGRPSLYFDGRKLDNAVRAALEELADVREPADARARPHRAGKRQDRAARSAPPRPTRCRSSSTGAGGKVTRGADPITAMKAVKNATEIDGARAAHRRDGAAMTRFLAWFDREAPAGKLTEIDAVEALETFRRETGLLKDVSFPTIAGAGPNGAIVHYRVTRKTNRKIAPGRTVSDRLRRAIPGRHHRHHPHVAVGAPTAEMRDRFTRVLKGHIAIATRGVSRRAPPARSSTRWRAQSLWQAGLDFDHGTGHGVGSYLSVHEGPARISKLGTVPLQARHDPVERARLLQDRRIRHPHRKPRAGDRRPEPSPARRSRSMRSRR